MTSAPEKLSIFSSWKPRLKGAYQALTTAKFAGFEAGQPSITRTQYSRYNTNPNTVGSQLERVAMIWTAEHLVKDVPLGIGYCGTRRVYSSPTGWLPNTGDSVLDREVKEFLAEEFETLGVNCSLWTLFEQATSGELPLGDACLIFARDSVDNLKLMCAGPDQIGEYYNFAPPSTLPQQGLTYFAGMYFDDNGNRQGFKIYQRGYNQVYTNAAFYPASDVIYLQDNMRPAVRGFTIFHGAIMALEKSYKLFQYGMDAAQKQAKVAVVASNNMGAPLDNLSYFQAQEGVNGNVFYIDRNFEGAQTQYQYPGDSFDYMKTEAPGPELIEGCRYADEQACLSLNMPYSMLVNMRDVGGAPSRLEIERASKEISRLCRLNESPFKRIVYTVLMDAVNKGIFSGNSLKYALTSGQVLFPTAPSADAYRDDQTDIKMVRAGLDSPQRVLGKYRMSPDEILKEKEDWAVMTSKAVENANRRLVEDQYKPTVSIADISQNSDNPQQAAQAEAIDTTGKPAPTTATPDATSTAKMAAFLTALMEGFDESKHPRASKGEEDGGEFTSGSGDGGESEESESGEKSKKEKTRKPNKREQQILDKSQPAKDEPLYHGTSATNLDSILKDGISPTDTTLNKVPTAWAGKSEDLARSYGAGNAAMHGSDEVASIKIKSGRDAGMMNYQGADSAAYKIGGIPPSAFERIDVYKVNAGKNDPPVRSLIPDGKGGFKTE